MEDKFKYWVWLSIIPGIGPRKGSQLIEYFKSPENIWHASEYELRTHPFLNKSNIDQLLEKKNKEVIRNILEKIKRFNIQVVPITDDLYPYYLKNTFDPPLVLFVRGKIIKDEKMIAVVGSRKASTYGLQMADNLSSELAKLGITVISGMARGVDSYAHSGALKGGGRTVAVLGCGPDIVYPSENGDLMNRIIRNGAVISEYVPGTPPIPLNFPARNRIISGMALGVVVVEANEKSGSLITANFALEQGREVFALPGNINNCNSKGTNRLIKDGAKIVTGVEDILEELNISNIENNIDIENKFSFKKEIMIKGLERNEQKIAELLAFEPLHIDVVSNKSGLSIQLVNSILVMLELNGIVEQLPGKIFKLIE